MSFVAEVTARRLWAAVATAQRAGRVPAVAAAVTRDGTEVWRGGHGTSTGAPDDPGPSPDQLQFRIGSITKTLTSVLLLQLRDAGEVSLGDPVSTYLPELARDPLAVWGRHTLRALLSHSSGLPAEPPGPWWERSPGRSFEELVAALAEDGGVPAPFQPGATHHYSNLGFALLGEVVVRVTGQPWWDRLAERVLAPLGMSRTTYGPVAPDAAGWSVHPYAGTLTEEPATDTGAMAPAGQAWSTASDLARFADLLLSRRPDVLSAQALREMGTPQSGTAATGLGAGYGLGLVLLPGGSGTLVGHLGSMPGFLAALLVDRVLGTGAVVLGNGTTGLQTVGLATRLLEELEECEPSVPAPWRPATVVPDEVADVLGVWHWGNTGMVARWDGALLHLTLLGTEFDRGTFALAGGRMLGVDGYHAGEPLVPHRRSDGSVSHLEVSTFVLTREPYDPQVR